MASDKDRLVPVAIARRWVKKMVELGIERQKFSARVFQALIKELEIHQKVLKSPKTFTHKKNMLN